MQQPCPEKGRMNRGIRLLGDVGLSHATETGRFRLRARLIYNKYRRGKMSICCSPKPATAAGATACALTMLLLDYLPRKGAHQSHEGDTSSLDSNGSKGTRYGSWQVAHLDLLPERMGLLPSCWDS